MIELRPFASLGAADHGWLDAHHHFSFASYHDPSRVHWGSLRVWNDDVIAPKSGFPAHPHSDMEIITYVRSGAITHQDSMGNEGRTEAGDVQVMSAGTGVRHSEWNADEAPCTLFQLWIIPDRSGGEPSWGARQFPKGERAGSFVPLASGRADDGDALPIRSDARVLGATVQAGESVTYRPDDAERHLYLVPATGKVRVAADQDEVEANARDGVAITQSRTLTITAIEDSELVLVDAA